jgi:hypothetical protein
MLFAMQESAWVEEAAWVERYFVPKRVRADIHDGPEHKLLQAEAGYIDARP